MTMMKKLFYLLFNMLTCLLTVGQGRNNGDPTGFMLPGNLVPVHYDVNWIFFDNCSKKENFTFERRFYGSTQIRVISVKSGVRVIEMNSYKLNITKATIKVGEGLDPIDLGLPTYYDSQRKVVFTTPFELPKSQPLIFNLMFEGAVNHAPEGIFIANDNIQGVMRETISTQFEAPNARRAFPCFDEPKYKATFRVSVNVSTCIIGKGYKAHSNTIQENTVEK